MQFDFIICRHPTKLSIHFKLGFMFWYHHVVCMCSHSFSGEKHQFPVPAIFYAKREVDACNAVCGRIVIARKLSICCEHMLSPLSSGIIFQKFRLIWQRVRVQTADRYEHEFNFEMCRREMSSLSSFSTASRAGWLDWVQRNQHHLMPCNKLTVWMSEHLAELMTQPHRYVSHTHTLGICAVWQPPRFHLS